MPGSLYHTETFLYRLHYNSSTALKYTVAFALIAFSSLWAADWGTIVCDMSGNKSVRLENSVLLVRYDYYVGEHAEHAIKALGLKTFSQRVNLAGAYIDACATRGPLTSAYVVSETTNRITARLTWGTDAEADITLYRDQPFIKLAYRKNGVNMVDITNAGPNYVIYGSDKWIRGFVEYEQCYYNRNDSYCTQKNGSGPDSDPGPLLYNGWFILGLHRADGLGYGRVMPAGISIIKLLPWGGKGFELFWGAQTGYLFVTDGGAEAILRTGKAIADWANAGERGLPFAVSSASPHVTGGSQGPRMVMSKAGIRTCLTFHGRITGPSFANPCAMGIVVVPAAGALMKPIVSVSSITPVPLQPNADTQGGDN